MSDSSTAFVEVGSSLEPLRSPFLMSLGERVRNLRSRKGMTRKAVALAADVSERHLANLEYGTGNDLRRCMCMETLRKNPAMWGCLSKNISRCFRRK